MAVGKANSKPLWLTAQLAAGSTGSRELPTQKKAMEEPQAGGHLGRAGLHQAG